MKFGKEFRIHLEETLPEWRDKFLCYKPLKKLLKHHFPASDVDVHDSLLPNPNPPLPPLLQLQDWFVKILTEELEKFNDFYVDKEEEFVIRLQELKQRIEQVKQKTSKSGELTSEAEFSVEMMDIRKEFVTIHGEMVLLKNYSSLNFAGLVKILKKYDKRTGGLLQLHFTQLALEQPFFTTEPLTRLVRECEAKLELLFPLEAEVVESPTDEQDQTNVSNPTPNEDTVNIPADKPPSLGEERGDVYRSTLAAMRTIQGLRRASSTSNPLSFGCIFGSQDNGNTGDVTAENSPCDSVAGLKNNQ
ncbi:SPX domain-containing protein 4 [Diospyros lotus]|uniref:SPX domain-containing protein 4 n=1 Tax=Diospyros lotus TaxID=55363 RepID=UPI00225689E7|nr:SPX domain-containing protein 4 [Diospyros lotus]